MKRIIIAVGLLIMNSCVLSPSYYQPPPETFETWKKSGASVLDVKKTLLECGSSPVDKRYEDYNTLLLADWCMEAQGYRNTVINMEEACKREHNAKYPACQPGAVIPKPSVERRLNSKYCQSARNMIDPLEFKQCLTEIGNPRYRTTKEDCIYWYRDLRAECLP